MGHSDIPSLPDDIPNTKLDFNLANNDVYTDCGEYLPPSAKHLKAHKRDNKNPGVCQSPTKEPQSNTNDIINNNNLSPLAPSPAVAPEIDILHTMFNDELLDSKTKDGNPCAEIHHVLCCLGPRQFFVNVQQCDFFAGALNCLAYEGAGIYCCLEVAYAGIGMWGLIGKYCE